MTMLISFKRWPLALSCALILGLSSPVYAQCSPELTQMADQIAQQDMVNEMQRIEDIYRGHMTQPQWVSQSDGLLTACSNNNWSTPSLSNPLMQRLMSKVQEQAVKQACDRARQMISEGAGMAGSSLRSIPGFSNVGNPDPTNLGGWNPIGQVGGGGVPGTGGVTWNDLGNLLPGGTISLPGITPPSPTPTNPGQPFPPASGPAPSNIPGIAPGGSVPPRP